VGKKEISDIRVLVIIPCYNEQGNIGNVLKSLQSLSIPGISITPLPVNDCSSDNTLEEIRKHARDYVNLPVNLGIGGAVQSGYKYARKYNFDIAVQFDGDGQHPAEYIGQLLQPVLNNESDVVIGSRFLNKEGFQSSAMRRFGINYFRHLNRWLLGINITDSTSGFRAVNKRTLELVCKYYPDTYPEPEAIALYHLNGLKIKEVAVVMKERESGQSSIGTFSSIYYMMKVTLGILFIFVRLRANGKRGAV
jgi:glycosyltransferase involved in cell wall biosynthesis